MWPPPYAFYILWYFCLFPVSHNWKLKMLRNLTSLSPSHVALPTTHMCGATICNGHKFPALKDVVLFRGPTLKVYLFYFPNVFAGAWKPPKCCPLGLLTLLCIWHHLDSWHCAGTFGYLTYIESASIEDVRNSTTQKKSLPWAQNIKILNTRFKQKC